MSVEKMYMITGYHLKVARSIYGFKTQEELAQELGVSVATIQRWVGVEEVDSKTLGVYLNDLHFDLTKVVLFIAKVRTDRQTKLFNRQYVHSGG